MKIFILVILVAVGFSIYQDHAQEQELETFCADHASYTGHSFQIKLACMNRSGKQ